MTVLRRLFGLIAVVGAIAAPSVVRAQASDTNSAAPATQPVGPSELENFSLPGNVTTPARTQPAPTQPAAKPTPKPATPSTTAPTQPSPEPATPKPAEPKTDTKQTEAKVAAPAPAKRTAPPKTATVEATVPPLGDSLSGQSAAASAPAAAPAQGDDIAWPWVALAGLIVIGAAAYALYQRRAAAFAGDAEAFAEVPPVQPVQRTEPTPVAAPPAPAPAPVAAPAEDLADLGLVSVGSSRMRPWLEIAFRPVAATLDDDQFVLEFELGLFNAGNREARAILVEASLFNADRDQDQVIGRFFDNPAGLGDRVVGLGASKRMAIRNKISIPRADIREFETDGRRYFVPVIAFNALYRWGEKEGQTSASFIVGRRTGGDKMAPLMLDTGARGYSGLGRKPLPTARRS